MNRLTKGALSIFERLAADFVYFLNAVVGWTRDKHDLMQVFPGTNDHMHRKSARDFYTNYLNSKLQSLITLVDSLVPRQPS